MAKCLWVAVALLLSGCASWFETTTASPESPVTALITAQPQEALPLPPVESVPVPGDLSLSPVAFEALPGWWQDDLKDGAAALRQTCAVYQRIPPETPLPMAILMGRASHWTGPCAALEALDDHDTEGFRAFLATWFQPAAVAGPKGEQGRFTGYYEASLRGSLTRSGPYQTPLYGLPYAFGGATEPPGGTPWLTRHQIETRSMTGIAPVLAWIDDPVDAFFLHVQGSGRVHLEDGRVLRVGYAGNNGHRFTGIGGLMLRLGLVARGQASMPAIRDWLKARPHQALALMHKNDRFIFFREIGTAGPLGGLGAPLTPLRSLAVDPAYIPMGVPMWLDTVDPDGAPLRRFMVAQDKGAAIKGAVRGDFYWGYGEAALAKAGRMSSQGRYFVLLPRFVPDVIAALGQDGPG